MNLLLLNDKYDDTNEHLKDYLLCVNRINNFCNFYSVIQQSFRLIFKKLDT